jgi:hypothetical protein
MIEPAVLSPNMKLPRLINASTSWRPPENNWDVFQHVEESAKS